MNVPQKLKVTVRSTPQIVKSQYKILLQTSLEYHQQPLDI